VKSAPERKVSGIFASDGVDFDNDLTDAHSIAPGQGALLSSWGHKAVDGDAPVGTAVVWRGKGHYGFDAQYLDTPEGHASFETVRQSAHLAQWSYALKAQREPATYEGKSCTRLRNVEVIELSPVTRAAGRFTRTLSAKAAGQSDPDDRYAHLHPALAEALKAAARTLAELNWKDRQDVERIGLELIKHKVETDTINAIRDELAVSKYLWGF
jgi:hypothetical protein